MTPQSAYCFKKKLQQLPDISTLSVRTKKLTLAQNFEEKTIAQYPRAINGVAPIDLLVLVPTL